MEKAEERREALGPDDLQLILLVRGQVAQSQSRLALHLGRGRIHEIDQRLDQPGLRLSQLPAVVGINGNVAECRRAVVLDIDI